MKLGLCVVGCGAFARTFSQAMQFLRDDIDLFFASRDLERARSYAAAFNGSGFFGSYEAAAADPRVQAMYLCTPHHLHRQHAVMAAEAGKHILVEKPLARTRQEACAMLDAARRAGVTLMVAENYRFLGPVQQSKPLIEAGALGSLRLIQLHEEASFRPVEWRNDRELNGGGAFIDGGIHKVDILLYLVGKPKSVYAVPLPRGRDDLEAEDGVVVTTRTAEGVVGLIHHAWASVHRPVPPWVSVSGSGGRLYFELGAHWLSIDDGTSERTMQLPDDHYGIVPMVREFRDSIVAGREPQVSGEVGLTDLEVVLKIHQALEQGTVVTLA